jgi:hypothetical protein
MLFLISVALMDARRTSLKDGANVFSNPEAAPLPTAVACRWALVAQKIPTQTCVIRRFLKTPQRESLMLSPSEEFKEGKWSVIFSFLTQLIGTSLDFREPLERSFDV